MIRFECKAFEDLTLHELYRVLQLRQEVFVVEQNCPYLDADDKDQVSYHILGLDKNQDIEAYTRLVPPGISYDHYSSIGRVLTSDKVRGQKVGVPLMEFSIQECLRLWPDVPIKISAQTYITKFYNSLGFLEIGEEYLEDDIPHIAMILHPGKD